MLSTICRISLVLLLPAIVRAAVDTTADWTDITTGLNGQSLTIGLGTPDNLVLRGNAFPVIVAQDGVGVMAAAARVSDAGGKVVAFNKEAYLQACGGEASPATALTCKLMVNSLRWAAGVAADGSNGTSFRLAMFKNVVDSTTINKLKTAATALGFTIQLPTGRTSHTLTDVSALGSGSSRIADVLLTDSYQAYTDTQRANTVAFVQQGAGIVIGGQAWSTGGNITQYNGNMLLAPLNCVQWTAQYGDSRSITVATTAPDPTLFNADMAAQAFLYHVQGTALLPADALSKVSATVKSAIDQAAFTWVTPASSPSAALWASFGSQLDVQLSNTAAGWTCGSVDAASPANQMAVAYLAKRNTDMLPGQMAALPCAATFPGLPGAGAVTLPSVTVTVNATYAGSYTGPTSAPPRGGGKWLSTGLWAPAGQPITVTISLTIAATLNAQGGQLGVQIGSHSDNIAHKTSWCRLPYGVLQRRWFTNAAGGDTITMTAGLGGLIYIYTKWGNTQGPMQVTVSGAMQAPFFFKGVTTEEEWRTSLRNSPVPWAELGSDKFVYTVPSSAVRNIDNPQAIVDLWDTVLDGYADLTVFTRDRPRAERIVVDCDISAGWMHSGYPIMAYMSEADYLNLPKWIGRDNGWGWFHELGHNHQWSAWTLPNQGEVTCNLYSLWASENIMKMNRTTRYIDRAAQQNAYFASGVFPADFETTTGMHQLMQLQENAGGRLNYTGGWQFWSRFLTRMQQLHGTAAVENDDVKIQTWIKETSIAANKNLVPFYRKWKFPIDPATELAVASLPAFDFDPTGPCLEECSNCCLPGALTPPVEEICKQTAPAGFTFHSKMDSAGNDLRQATVDGSWASAAEACTGNPYCIGVLTSGWMKHTLRTQSNWRIGFSDPCSGLLVKQDQSGGKLPSALTTPSTVKTGGLCVEISGSRFQLAACSGAASQLWVAGPAPNSNRIQAPSGNTCFDVASSGSTPGSIVLPWSCHTSNNQKWAVDTLGRLVPRHATNMCLDTEGSSLAAGAKLVLNVCSDAASQKFFAPEAAASCIGPVTVANGIFPCNTTLSGQTCAGSCNSGYAGAPVAACTNGVYTVSGICQPAACSEPVTIPNGAFSCPTTLIGQTCAGVCNSGYSGAPVATCTDGLYVVSGSCQPASCTGLVTVPNGTFSCAETESGQTCAGVCNSGFSGAPVATCTNGAYSVSGSCQPASCSGPVTIANGAFSCATTLSGQTCAGVCNSGFSGAPVASCTNGEYSVSGSCQPASCSGPVTVTDGTFSCGTTLSGQTCAGSCNTGFSGAPIARCTNGVYNVSGSCVRPSLIPTPSTLRVSTLSRCVSVNGNNLAGTQLVLRACSTTPGAQPYSQRWVSSVSPNPKRIQTAATTGGILCMAAAGSTRGSRVVVTQCSTATSQQWTQDAQGRLVPGNAPTMCLDTTQSRTTAGTLYVINTCRNAASQKFTVTPVARHHRRLMA